MKGDLSKMYTRKSRRMQACTALITAGLSLAAALAGAGPAPAAGTAETATTAGGEQYRPAIHYTPKQNWMNDPNGMVFHKGVYHLYYPVSYTHLTLPTICSV